MNWDWVDEQNKKNEENREKGYFTIQEGDNRFVLLSHFAPLAQVFENGKYRPAQEGDTKISIKGVCWVYQDGVIKQAKMPYDDVVKKVRAMAQEPDWEFTFPFPHVFNLHAKNAKTKEVEYSLTTSPKKIEIPAEILEELAKKPTPEEVVEKIKNNAKGGTQAPGYDYPEDELNPEDIPF